MSELFILLLWQDYEVKSFWDVSLILLIIPYYLQNTKPQVRTNEAPICLLILVSSYFHLGTTWLKMPVAYCFTIQTKYHSIIDCRLTQIFYKQVDCPQGDEEFLFYRLCEVSALFLKWIRKLQGMDFYGPGCGNYDPCLWQPSAFQQKLNSSQNIYSQCFLMSYFYTRLHKVSSV